MIESDRKIKDYNNRPKSKLTNQKKIKTQLIF